MASLIEGYTYDIFISYRQKDNRHDRWVTEFVDHLKGELEATFKEDISIYFDENQKDGLLETYNVDKSLEGKLKCLIFMPIISQTYCDTKSFAWQHELCAFNKLTKEDKFGRDIKLSSGNVASRILPVKIHDLDHEDKTLLETELGGVLRCVDFIYKAAGVNRPLRANEDHPQHNLNKTNYRDQINKVANAIKEIIHTLRKHGQQIENTSRNFDRTKTSSEKWKTILAVASASLLVLLVAGYFLLQKMLESSEPFEKSVAVLPFTNLSNDPEQEYFSDGIVEAILNHLFKVGELKVISSTSTKRFKNTELSIKEIARQLGVSSILEGSVQKIGSSVRITAQLIDTKTDTHLWSETYDEDLSDIFSIQTEVAQNVARELKATLSAKEKEQIEINPTDNAEAYNLYLQGRFFWNTRTKEGLDRSAEYFKKAIASDPDYALAYAGLADAYFIQAYWGWIPWIEGTDKSRESALRALDIDKNLAEAHTVLGALLNYRDWKWEEARKELRLAVELDPNFVTAHHYYSELLSILNEKDAARRQINIALQLDPFLPVLHILSSGYFYNEGKLNEALEECQELKKLDPDYGNRSLFWREFKIFCMQKEDLKALEALHMALYLDTLNVAFSNPFREVYEKSGINGLWNWLIESELNKSKPQPLTLATSYAILGRKKEALNWLEKASGDSLVELPFINNNPDYNDLRSEPGFQEIIKKMGLGDYQ